MTFKPGDPKIGGRKRGTANKRTDEGRQLALKYSQTAIEKLNSIVTTSQDDRAVVAAAKEIMDRAFGKSSGVLATDPNNNTLKIVLVGDDAKL